MERKRHLGYIKSTGSDCVIIARDNPNNPGHALIVQQNSLPDQFREYLMDAVLSGPGQQTLELYRFIQGRSSPDFNMNLLKSLHARGYIQQEPTSNVILVASKNEKIELDKLLEHERGQKQPSQSNFTKTGVLENNLLVEQKEERFKIAQNLLAQAKELENEVIKRKEQAYDLYPELRPNTEISFLETPTTKEEIIVETPTEQEQHLNDDLPGSQSDFPF